MRRSVNQLMQIEIVTLGSACIFGIFALINGYLLLVIAAVYFVVISLVCEALIKLQFAYRTEAGKQFVRAILLFLLTTYFFMRM